MIQAITLLVIAALVAIDQVIKIAVVNRFDGFSDDFYGCCYSHVHFPAHD